MKAMDGVLFWSNKVDGSQDNLTNITNQDTDTLISLTVSVDKIFTHRSNIMNRIDNPGSNPVGVAQHIYNIRINLPSQILEN